MSAHGKYFTGAAGIKATKRATIKCFEIHVKSYAYYTTFLQANEKEQ
jgi:hypothetical protein